MVLGTVSATNAASQQLRLDYITTKPLGIPDASAGIHDCSCSGRKHMFWRKALRWRLVGRAGQRDLRRQSTKPNTCLHLPRRLIYDASFGTRILYRKSPSFSILYHQGCKAWLTGGSACLLCHISVDISTCTKHPYRTCCLLVEVTLRY